MSPLHHAAITPVGETDLDRLLRQAHAERAAYLAALLRRIGHAIRALAATVGQPATAVAGRPTASC